MSKACFQWAAAEQEEGEALPPTCALLSKPLLWVGAAIPGFLTTCCSSPCVQAEGSAAEAVEG